MSTIDANIEESVSTTEDTKSETDVDTTEESVSTTEDTKSETDSSTKKDEKSG